MKHFSKFLLSIILILTAYNTVSFASEVKTMTVDEAVTYALSHSNELTKCDAAILTSEYQYYQSKITHQNILKADSITPDSYLIASGYSKDAANLQYIITQRAKEIKKNDIILQTKKDFYTYINSKEIVNTATLNLNITKSKLEAAKYRFESGAISELDYKNFVLLNMNAQNNLNNAKRNCEMNLLTLKNTINYNEPHTLSPIGEIRYTPEEIINADTAINLSKNTVAYKNISDTLALAEKKWKLTSIHFTSGTYNYKIEKGIYETAVIDNISSVNSIDMNIRKTYNSLLSIKEQIELSEFNLGIQKTTTDATYLRYEMGSATASVYNESMQKYMSAENDLQSLKLNYLITKLTYENMYKDYQAEV